MAAVPTLKLVLKSKLRDLMPRCEPAARFEASGVLVSAMSIEDGRVAVVSQVNSMLWVGRFDEADWTWHKAGQLYKFPRTEKGSIKYGNVEGVGWVTQKRIVTVSDKRKKKEQPDKALSEKDQSIHLFDIPE